MSDVKISGSRARLVHYTKVFIGLSNTCSDEAHPYLLVIVPNTNPQSNVVNAIVGERLFFFQQKFRTRLVASTLRFCIRPRRAFVGRAKLQTRCSHYQVSTYVLHTIVQKRGAACLRACRKTLPSSPLNFYPNLKCLVAMQRPMCPKFCRDLLRKGGAANERYLDAANTATSERG